MADKTENKMRDVRIFKVTLNFGAGKNAQRLEKGVSLLRNITGIEPVKTKTYKRLAAWGLRPGLPIGCKITLRGDAAKEVVSRILYALDNRLKENAFDNEGNVAFGLSEYIEIKDIEYDPKIGIEGFQVTITLERPGYRIKRRKYFKKKVSKRHRVSKDDAKRFMKQEFNIIIGDEEK